jgi:hypothetical protein
MQKPTQTNGALSCLSRTPMHMSASVSPMMATWNKAAPWSGGSTAQAQAQSSSTTLVTWTLVHAHRTKAT